MNRDFVRRSIPDLACVVIILVGPQEVELNRLRDLLSSFSRYESPASYGIVLIADGVENDEVGRLLADFESSILAVLPNPRYGRGYYWTQGATVALFTGLHWIAKNTPNVKFVLKVDTDSLIINPFIEQIGRFFQSHPDAGLIGSYHELPGGRGPNGSQQQWAHVMRKLTRPFWLWRMTPEWHWQFALWGRGRRLRRLMCKALVSGYEFGENCQGGGYAISQAALLAMENAGILADPWLLFNRPVAEDMLIAVLIRAAGFKPANFNGRGEPFGVQWLGLCATPAELVDEGYAIIHSVKDGRDHEVFIDEPTVRRFFADRRGYNTARD